MAGEGAYERSRVDEADLSAPRRCSPVRRAPAVGMGGNEPGWGPGRARSATRLAAPIVRSARALHVLLYVVALRIFLLPTRHGAGPLGGQAARRRNWRECP